MIIRTFQLEHLLMDNSIPRFMAPETSSCHPVHHLTYKTWIWSRGSAQRRAAWRRWRTFWSSSGSMAALTTSSQRIPRRRLSTEPKAMDTERFDDSFSSTPVPSGGRGLLGGAGRGGWEWKHAFRGIKRLERNPRRTGIFLLSTGACVAWHGRRCCRLTEGSWGPERQRPTTVSPSFQTCACWTAGQRHCEVCKLQSEES